MDLVLELQLKWDKVPVEETRCLPDFQIFSFKIQ